MKYIRFFERVFSLIFIMLITFGFELPYLAILTLISAVIHEVGHLVMIGFTKREPISLPSPVLSGFRIRRTKALSYREEILISFGGPLINLSVFAFCLIYSSLYPSEYVLSFGIINLMNAITNLLPMESYDGYKILSALLYNCRLEKYASGILFSLSVFFSATFTLLSLYILMKIGEGYWMFGIFFTSLLATLRKTTIFENS